MKLVMYAYPPNGEDPIVFITEWNYSVMGSSVRFDLPEYGWVNCPVTDMTAVISVTGNYLEINLKVILLQEFEALSASDGWQTLEKDQK